MIPITQQRLMDEMDAYRAAIASLLELDADAVPSFSGLSADMKLLAWLSDFNVTRVRLHHFDPPPMLWIARTQSPYPGYEIHSVVMRAGVLLHDPHPEPQPFAMDQVLAADVFAPMDPALPFARFATP